MGSRLCWRPLRETNHEFFVHLLCVETGPEWRDTQTRRPEADRHPIVQWVAQWDALRSAHDGPDVREEREGVFSAEATGDLLSLIGLAYDVYTLLHAAALPGTVVNRLKTDDQFQGARYELAVAAVFARAGYDIEWVTATDRRLPEFIARHPERGTEIAVEAKSRHRPGILGRAGDPPPRESLKVDVIELVRSALQKEVDGRAFVICIDLNLPTDGQGAFEEWVQELGNRALADFQSSSAENPDPFSAIFFTNYSWHWNAEEPAGRAMHFVAVPLFPSVALGGDEIGLLSEAVFQYGDIPPVSDA